MLSQSKTKEAFDFTLKDIIIPQREKPGHIYQKEDTLQNDLQKETTVVGAIGSLTSNAVSSVVAGAGLFLLVYSLVALRTASQLCDSENEHLSSLPYSGYPNPKYEVKDCVLDGVSLTGVLVVMLIFSVLEHLLAAYASVFWWKQIYSSNPGAIQILLALIIMGIGTIFAVNYFLFSQRFPLVFCTGYTFWGALIFIITGYFTGLNWDKKHKGHSVMAMNVISTLTAVAGITLTIISFQYQHQYCKMPSLEGICVIGRVLYNGILSVLLILSIAELSISVTTASFRSKCWTKSNEIVFFLPLDVTQKNELSTTEEDAIIQFDFQEECFRDESTGKMQPVFFGGYTFFKLRVSRNPLTIHHPEKRGSNNCCTTSLSESDEQQKNIPPSLRPYETDTEQQPLSVILEKRPSEETGHNEQINDEDQHFAIEQPPEMQTQSMQANSLTPQVFPSNSVKSLEALPRPDLSSQDLLVKASLSETPPSHVTQSHDTETEDMPSQDIPSSNTPSQDMSSQDMPYQDIQLQNMPSQEKLSQVQVLPPLQAMLFEAPTFLSHDLVSEDMIPQSTQSKDIQSQNMPSQDMLSRVQVLPQSMLSEAQHSCLMIWYPKI
ncbi:Membrane-spanning 4-domains subfamily A member 14 [Myotis brandtii]|uniref:Membrane-spanning 4-domains subfamily A member 14 n=1 Tax=Myotis brandtii TaxID=109478 RepID=S7P1Y4_MYOBR|nr:Membrane-spanning 4-domains subfamily A member 14 [Myotis brandtii]